MKKKEVFATKKVENNILKLDIYYLDRSRWKSHKKRKYYNKISRNVQNEWGKNINKNGFFQFNNPFVT